MSHLLFSLSISCLTFHAAANHVQMPHAYSWLNCKCAVLLSMPMSAAEQDCASSTSTANTHTRAGKVKYVGLSEVTPDEIRAAHAIHPLTCVEQEWSLWSRDIEAGIVPVCRELGIGVLAYSPLGRGFLTGALDVTKLPPGDFRVFGQPRLQVRYIATCNDWARKCTSRPLVFHVQTCVPVSARLAPWYAGSARGRSRKPSAEPGCTIPMLPGLPCSRVAYRLRRQFMPCMEVASSDC